MCLNSALNFVRPLCRGLMLVVTGLVASACTATQPAPAHHSVLRNDFMKITAAANLRSPSYIPHTGGVYRCMSMPRGRAVMRQRGVQELLALTSQSDRLVFAARGRTKGQAPLYGLSITVDEFDACSVVRPHCTPDLFLQDKRMIVRSNREHCDEGTINGDQFAPSFGITKLSYALQEQGVTLYGGRVEQRTSPSSYQERMELPSPNEKRLKLAQASLQDATETLARRIQRAVRRLDAGEDPYGNLGLRCLPRAHEAPTTAAASCPSFRVVVASEGELPSGVVSALGPLELPAQLPTAELRLKGVKLPSLTVVGVFAREEDARDWRSAHALEASTKMYRTP